MKIIDLVIVIILLAIGAFYLILPHSIHITSKIGFGLSHSLHMIIGAILFVLGITVLIIRKNKK